MIVMSTPNRSKMLVVSDKDAEIAQQIPAGRFKASDWSITTLPDWADGGKEFRDGWRGIDSSMLGEPVEVPQGIELWLEVDGEDMSAEMIAADGRRRKVCDLVDAFR